MSSTTPDLSPGTSISLFNLPAANWTALNRRAALLAHDWTPAYNRQFVAPTLPGFGPVAGTGYTEQAYSANCRQWIAKYFPLLATIAGQAQEVGSQLNNLANNGLALTTQEFTDQFNALETLLTATGNNVHAFCDFFVPYLVETSDADKLGEWQASTIPLGTYPKPDVYLAPFGGMSQTLQTAVGEFQTGWANLLTQFSSASQVVTSAGAASPNQLMVSLDLSAAAISWSGVQPSLAAFTAMSATQAENFDGSYLYTAFPPFPGLTIGDSYHLGFTNYWLEVATVANPSLAVTLTECAPHALATQLVQTWKFEAIPGGFGSYYLINSEVGDSHVLTCSVDPNTGFYDFNLVPRSAAPANGWIFFDYGPDPSKPWYALANVAQGLLQQLAALIGGNQSPTTPCLTLNTNIAQADPFAFINLTPIFSGPAPVQPTRETTLRWLPPASATPAAAPESAPAATEPGASAE